MVGKAFCKECTRFSPLRVNLKCEETGDRDIFRKNVWELKVDHLFWQKFS